MKNSLKCAHPACACRARKTSRYCSTECEAADSRSASHCDCGHRACGEGEDPGGEGSGAASAKTT